MLMTIALTTITMMAMLMVTRGSFSLLDPDSAPGPAGSSYVVIEAIGSSVIWFSRSGLHYEDVSGPSLISGIVLKKSTN